MPKKTCHSKTYLSAVALSLLTACGGVAESQEPVVGAAEVSFYGYDDCLQLRNESTTVTLCPATGGRVLEYALNGVNVLYLPPGDEGWLLSDADAKSDGGQVPMNAGRFDIGPEMVRRRSNVLWAGRWKGEITGDRAARLTSQVDPVAGVQLIRDFELAADDSSLRCTQTIKNVSGDLVSLCHWSRTFAVGGGIAVVPRSPDKALERFPVGWVMYGPQKTIQTRPADPDVRVDDDAIFVNAAPAFPKLGFDSYAGWLAYLAPNDLMFVKRFATYPDRAYNELAGLTISVWYPKDRPAVELEPIGPAENLKPGRSASFTETWSLLEKKFPGDADAVTFAEVHRVVEGLTE